jgi:hypothetical protein
MRTAILAWLVSAISIGLAALPQAPIAIQAGDVVFRGAAVTEIAERTTAATGALIRLMCCSA